MKPLPAAVLILAILALFGLVGADDYKTAVMMDQATEAEKAEMLRYARQSVLNSYSSAGVPRSVRVAEVWK